jgi:hypothetical protein
MVATVTEVLFVLLSGRRSAARGKDSSRQSRSESKQQESRLVETEAPQNSSRFVSGVFLKILPRTRIQEVHQARVAGLVKIVDDFANQQMNIQLPAKLAQFAARFAIQDRFADTHGAPKARDNTAYSSDFHMTGRISHQIDVAAG